MDKEILLKNFGFNIKIARMKKKISQEKLAEELNFSAVYISNVEGGKCNISLTNAVKLSNYFKSSIEELLKEK